MQTEVITLKREDLFADGSSKMDASARRLVTEHCWKGNILLIKGLDLGLDLNRFSMTDVFPSQLCKIGAVSSDDHVGFDFHDRLPFRLVYAGGSTMEAPYLNETDLTKICNQSFDGDWALFSGFIENCQLAETRLREFVGKVLADYDYYNDCVVWRFSQREVTGLHFDRGPNIEGKESLRFFVNLDINNRHWKFSDTLLDMIEESYVELNLQKYFMMNQKNRMVHLIKAVMASDRFANAARKKLEFEAGDVWIFDGRIVSHELVEGRGALSLTTKLRRNALPDFHRGLKERLFDIHNRKQALGTSAAVEAA